MTNKTQNLGIIKIIGGVLIAVAGMFGLIKSQSIKHRLARFTASVVSLIVIGGGLYMMVLGFDDIALGQIGHTRLGNAKIKSLVYHNPQDFEASLKTTFTQETNKKIRRLHFKCSDDSNRFTVYNTHFGITGIPGENIQCRDKSFLLVYNDKPI